MIYPPVLIHSYRQAVLPHRKNILATAAGDDGEKKKGDDAFYYISLLTKLLTSMLTLSLYFLYMFLCTFLRDHSFTN